MNLDILHHFVPFTAYPYRGESVGCPVCSCDRGTQVAGLDRRFKRLPTYACEDCGLLFTNPMPTEEELGHYYSRLYRFDYQIASDAPKQRHLRKRTNEAEARVVQVSDLLPPQARTLDFGCGSGEFVTSLLALGHDAYGFEPGLAYGNYARSIHGNRVEVKGWQDVSYRKPFDLVSCFHVLEHLSDPIGALKQMAEWTAPDGLLYVEVPDMAFLSAKKGFAGFHFAHLIGFNHHNLLLAGSIAGLEPKVVVSPTGIIFGHGTSVERANQAERGRSLTSSVNGRNQLVHNYFRHQLGKAFCK